ncbi:DUF3352 domain-containing protein [Nocardioides perillae]|uniref:DUF3352 domain-containing protein n=1 Tax=Nocardioides perillae TaxID=1119534 RepID=A0A7Y9RTU5_9ACTN|nr:DUF3352 domain-containing protein [Nocardioides perillae]NYG56215.1 hypothetical protein [Nocardioides perillae]
MSSTVPPTGPASGPEHLSGPEPRSGPVPGRGRRRVLVGGAVVAVAGLVGGGAWAATSFFGTGAQPSEALPADTLGYVSVDLDPSGEQKIEALRMLREFPAFRDEVGLETDDDVRRYLVEQTLGGEDGCEGLDYDDDVEPWLGDRFAVAALPAGDEGDEPRPVAVLQVSDESGAEEGLTALATCAGAGEVGFAVADGWAVVTESDEAAEAVVESAASGSLADDPDFTRWTGQVEAGVLTAYAAPEVGQAYLDFLESAASSGGDELPFPSGSPLDGLAGGFALGLGNGEVPEELRRQAEAFDGGAGALSFDDGGLELEVAMSDTSEGEAVGARGGEAVRSLPADTAAAFGLGLPDGWAQRMLDGLDSGLGAQAEALLGTSLDELLATAEQQTGLQLPEDLETLLGDSLAVAVGGDFSLREAEQSEDGSEVPVGAKVVGDAEGIVRVLDALDAALGFGQVLGDDAEGDAVALSPSADYREQLLGDGGLGDDERFEEVVEEADEASVLLFVDLDAAWVQELSEMAASGGDSADEVVANVEPLSALGMSSWTEDGTARFSLQLTTD